MTFTETRRDAGRGRVWEAAGAPRRSIPSFLPSLLLPFESAADAFGEGNACGVGGWLRVGSSHCFWFSERFTPGDFRSLGIPVKDDANLDIASCETLAQGFLLILHFCLGP